MNADLRGLIQKWRTNVCLAREEKGLLRAADELEAALSVAQGQGFVMVPREPTEAMLDAGCAQHHCAQGDSYYSEPDLTEQDARAVYTAMLAAAAAPAQPDDAEAIKYAELVGDNWDKMSETARNTARRMAGEKT